MAAPLPTVYVQGLGAINADGLNTFVQTVVNYAQLRTFTGLQNMVVSVQGAVAPADGGQGTYYFSASSTAADNNSTVIVPNGAVQGAWLQIPPGTIANLTLSGNLSVGGTASFAGVATFGADIVMSGTGELQLASGTTGQRSASPANGMIRYNTTLNQLEFYGASGWTPVATPTTSGIFPGDIFGLTPSSIAGTNTTATLTVNTGKATDTTAATILSLATAASWAVTNGNAINGYQGGTTLPNSSTIHFFICSGANGTGSFASLSATAPTLPTGYSSFFRRIFSITTSTGGSPNPYTADEIGGGSLMCYLGTGVADLVGTNIPNAARTLYSMSVPVGIKVEWMGNATSPNATAMWISSPDEPDLAPTNNLATATQDMSNQVSYTQTTVSKRRIITNTGGQIGFRAGSATPATYAYTTGWIDSRRT